MQTLRQRAFRLAGEQFGQPLGHDQAEHPVAEEFEPLVILRALAAMGQRALEQVQVGRRVAGGRGDPAGETFTQKPCPMRLQRAALNHVHGNSQEAEPSVDQKVNSALPSTRSSGT
jgi:hypothetical protein